MTNQNDSPQMQTLPSGHLTVVHVQSNAVVLIDSRTGVTDTVSLKVTQAMKLHKLLSMSGDPIPTYRDSKEFFLAVDTPQSEDASPHPIVTADETTVRVISNSNNEIVIHPEDIDALIEVLDEWDIMMVANPSSETDVPQRSVLSLPAMIQLGDGITEPLLHAEYDEVLEHYHQSVGYWSCELGDYVSRT